MHSHPVDAGISALAARQHGVVARRQLVDLGLGDDAIDHRLARGRLHPLHRGVYAVGHSVVSVQGRWTAAVLAVPGAVLSHRSAAALWDLRPTARGRVEVSVARAVRSRPGLQVHREPLATDEWTARRRIPVTTAARTLLDLAAVLPRHQLERAVEQAERLRLADHVSLDALFARHPRRKGVPALKDIVEPGRLALTRSDLEARFLTFLDDYGIPRPRTNATIGAGGRRLEIDGVWRSAKLAVELDGHTHHATRAAFERDRARDRALQAAGWRVIRLTWRQLHEEPAAVATDIVALLEAARGEGPTGRPPRSRRSGGAAT